jgi:dTDP-4-dehydrorhamnose 3,5-epimerase
MNVIETNLPGVLLIEPKVHGDARGFFLETFHSERYAVLNAPPFVQDNWSRSAKGILRGLHLQNPNAQGKLVQVMAGAVFDVAVDVRKGSPTFGQHYGVELSAENKRQLYVPPGFAHGFCVLTDSADFVYKCTALYTPQHEVSILWNDPDIGIAWPIPTPLLSTKDANGLRLKDAGDRLPSYVNQ